MGSRLSMPKGTAGTTEMSHPRKSPYPTSRIWNSRQVVAPLAAFSMACILFVYTRTSIRVAKANAQRHREADSGGQGLDLLRESRRRHGRAEAVEEGGTVKQLASGMKAQILGGEKKDGTSKMKNKDESQAPGKSEEENKLKAAMGRRKDGT